MERVIRECYTDAILDEAMRRYGISKDQIRSLNAFESFIYEFEHGDGEQAFILRIAHSSRRSEALILGEVDWINYLAEGGVPAARAIVSERGKLVEAIEDGHGGHFLVTAFVKANGQPPWKVWSPGLYETYGEVIGRMHTLAKDYVPAQPALRRPEWDDALFEFPERYLPAFESLAKRKYGELCRQVNQLPKDRDAYGMIHQDAHGSNFFVDTAGRITLFDFDECAYSWFINEVAIVLFYVVQDAQDWPAFTRAFMGHFLRGYVRACPLDSVLLKEIPAFLKMREIELYAVLHRDFDVGNIDNEWCARFMQGRKASIEQDRPFIDFDFDSLAGLVLE
ncbi:MAG: hypothetical protein CVU39_25970 [Chloroflexi bacterium HGW-Chloroflexi-10]|nr:MAG: hypothetical protein CVU39_25970 [Chloroflexi bacterium HGW-Chloroflexi-10]